jgi:pilus retraction protein PilT
MDIASLINRKFGDGVSDIHLTPGIHPTIRENGVLCELTEFPVLTPFETDEAARFLLTETQYARFESQGETDISRFFGDTNIRARINVFKQRGSVAIAIRLNNMRVKSMSELGLPEAYLTNLCKLTRGLILVTGPTGVGKTTTIASMVDWMNRNRSGHIITIEDPIEFIYKHDKCIINQRQVGTDSQSFSSALKSVLRQDPDVIVVGEMRDLESISAALTAAETGHLVISSLHTVGAVKTVDRIIDVFPSVQQQQIRIQLSMVLQAIISQQLIPRADGKGRVLATEIISAVPAARNMIRTEKTHQLQNVIVTNSKDGMRTLDASLLELYRGGTITETNTLAYGMDQEYLSREIAAVKK